MATFAYILAIIITLVLPIVLSFIVVRRNGSPWMAFMIGGLAFLVASIVTQFALSAIIPTDTYTNLIGGFPPEFFLLFYIFTNTVIISLLQVAARYLGFRISGNQSATWRMGLISAVGFACFVLVLNYGLNGIDILSKIYTALPTTIPDGVTPQDFAAYVQQVHDLTNANFTGALIYSQLIPGLYQFTLQFALSLMVWVGLAFKKWLWVAAAFLFETAFFAVSIVVGGWMDFYHNDPQLYTINFVVGTLIFVALMAFNAGIVYVIYKQFRPLAPAYVQPVMTRPGAQKPSASKPAPELAPRTKSVSASKPTKKLKNTDLK